MAYENPLVSLKAGNKKPTFLAGKGVDRLTSHKKIHRNRRVFTPCFPPPKKKGKKIQGFLEAIFYTTFCKWMLGFRVERTLRKSPAMDHHHSWGEIFIFFPDSFCRFLTWNLVKRGWKIRFLNCFFQQRWFIEVRFLVGWIQDHCLINMAASFCEQDTFSSYPAENVFETGSWLQKCPYGRGYFTERCCISIFANHQFLGSTC